MRRPLLLVVALALAPLAAFAESPKLDEAMVRNHLTVNEEDIQLLKSFGPAVMPLIAKIYPTLEEGKRVDAAVVLYRLGWKSAEAKAALLRDINTSNESLRIHVQWALGRISNDDDVVDLLAQIMRNDPNPLFRDKAACALAEDQIHLTDSQKVRLYSKLIDGLSDPKIDVRGISILALRIQTGQTKGYQPNAGKSDRDKAITVWRKWLQEYAENL